MSFKFCVFVYLWGVGMYVSASDAPELELESGCGPLMWVLGTGLRPSAS